MFQTARRTTLLGLIVTIWLMHFSVTAQTIVKMRASTPEVSDFPSINLTLSLTDNTGKHIPGLDASNFLVLEDGKPLHDIQVEENIVGTRQIFIINTSRSMRSRDAFAMTRFDYVRESLVAWWSDAEVSTVDLDDLNLITSEGPIVEHSSVAAELASAIYAFEPEFVDELASFDLLLEAFKYTTDPAPRVGMPTHIFFVTPLIFGPEEIPLAETIAKAKDEGITIFPILVGPEEILDYPEIEDIRLLAEETGGELIYYDSEIGLSFLGERILSQRTLYNLTYESQVNSSGSHRVQIQATESSFDVLSNQQIFEIELSAPSVSFIQPPQSIVRQADDVSLPIEALPPLSSSLNIQITFPDGYLRPVTSSTLFVDDQIVHQNLEPPFDEFIWNLGSYTHTEDHVLQVLVEDSLGLQGFSTEMQISVEVITPPSGLTAIEPAIGNFLMILGVIVSGLIVSVSIISLTRRRRNTESPIQTDERPGRKSRHRATLRRNVDQATIEAKLEGISPQAPSFHLLGTDIILGRDAALSAVHLDDPSVSGLHARLTRLASGDYLIRDQGSVGGTWVNFTPVPEAGSVLRHGDTIHLGRIRYRFFLAKPPPPKKINVSIVDGDEPFLDFSDPISREEE
jgi:hypothetical protein